MPPSGLLEEKATKIYPAGQEHSQNDSDKHEESQFPNRLDKGLKARTAEAVDHHTFFRKRYLDYLDKVKNTPLSVLVWGPSLKGQSPLSEKRKSIINELRSHGFDAFASEELQNMEYEAGYSNMPLNVKEYLQACAADIVVVLQASVGSTGEVHDFAPYQNIAPKLVVFVDEHIINGYSGGGALRILRVNGGTVINYRNPQDIEECHLLSLVVECVRERQYAKFLMDAMQACGGGVRW